MSERASRDFRKAPPHNQRRKYANSSSIANATKATSQQWVHSNQGYPPALGNFEQPELTEEQNTAKGIEATLFRKCEHSPPLINEGSSQQPANDDGERKLSELFQHAAVLQQNLQKVYEQIEILSGRQLHIPHPQTDNFMQKIEYLTKELEIQQSKERYLTLQLKMSEDNAMNIQKTESDQLRAENYQLRRQIEAMREVEQRKDEVAHLLEIVKAQQKDINRKDKEIAVLLEKIDQISQGGGRSRDLSYEPTHAEADRAEQQRVEELVGYRIRAKNIIMETQIESVTKEEAISIFTQQPFKLSLNQAEILASAIFGRANTAPMTKLADKIRQLGEHHHHITVVNSNEMVRSIRALFAINLEAANRAYHLFHNSDGTITLPQLTLMLQKSHFTAEQIQCVVDECCKVSPDMQHLNFRELFLSSVNNRDIVF